ncbi:MAG: hypothetical protein AB7U62_19185 [Pseudolabrys sp.]
MHAGLDKDLHALDRIETLPRHCFDLVRQPLEPLPECALPAVILLPGIGDLAGDQLDLDVVRQPRQVIFPAAAATLFAGASESRIVALAFALDHQG